MVFNPNRIAGFYLIRDIQLKNVDGKVESFNKKVKLNKILNSSIEYNEHKLFLYNYHIGTVLSIMLFLRKKFTNSITLFSYLDALLEIKSQQFAGEESEG